MNTDPIIAALHRQQRLHDAFNGAIDTPKCARARNAYNTAFDKLIRTRPKTRAGAVALIRHCLAEDARFPTGPTGAEGGDAMTLLRTLAKAMPALRD